MNSFSKMIALGMCLVAPMSAMRRKLERNEEFFKAAKVNDIVVWKNRSHIPPPLCLTRAPSVRSLVEALSPESPMHECVMELLRDARKGNADAIGSLVKMCEDDDSFFYGKIRSRVPEWTGMDGTIKKLNEVILHPNTGVRATLKRKSGAFQICPDHDTFVDSYALGGLIGDLARGEKLDHDGSLELELERRKKTAEALITGNQCPAFTTWQDRQYYLKKPTDMTETHECIHILSGKGGMNTFYKTFGVSVLEGVTQFWTEQVCLSPEYKVEVTEAYPGWVRMTKQSLLLGSDADGYNEERLRLVYNAYFRGDVQDQNNVSNVDHLLDAIYEAKIQSLREKEKCSWGEKKHLTIHNAGTTDKEYKSNKDAVIKKCLKELKKEYDDAL